MASWPGSQKNSMTAIKASDVDRFIAKPNPAQPIMLVFGPDAGLVRERVDALVRASVDDPNDPFALARIEGDELAGNPRKARGGSAHGAAVRRPTRRAGEGRCTQYRRLRSKPLLPHRRTNAASSSRPAISAKARRCAHFVKRRKLLPPCPAMPIMNAHSPS